jgi:hypothetical protein
MIRCGATGLSTGPCRGLPIADGGGPTFSVQSVQLALGPANGPHYSKTEQVVVRTDCAAETPNCAPARAKNLVGMEVVSVDGVGLAPEKGMVRQILNAFANAKAPATVALILYGHAADSQPVEVAFRGRAWPRHSCRPRRNASTGP